ncbi:MAG: hypothetical protein AABY75_08795 [Bacteroidota bacterium]
MRTIALAVLVAFASTILVAQVKPIHFKKLQECLPSKVFKGFERKKPTGNTQSTMGMSTSEAVVEYEQPAKENLKEGEEPPPQVSLIIKIQDMVGMPYALMPYAWMQEFENETEDGYEKTVMVLGKYKGTEKGATGDDKSLKTTFGVANRYIIEVEISSSDDAKLLAEVITAIDFAKLEKLTSDAK